VCYLIQSSSVVSVFIIEFDFVLLHVRLIRVVFMRYCAIIIIIIIINEEIIVAFSPKTTRTRYKVKENREIRRV